MPDLPDEPPRRAPARSPAPRRVPPPHGERRLWALIASTWVHVVLAFVGFGTPPSPSDTEARPLNLVALPRPADAVAAGDVLVDPSIDGEANARADRAGPAGDTEPADAPSGDAATADASPGARTPADADAADASGRAPADDGVDPEAAAAAAAAPSSPDPDAASADAPDAPPPAPRDDPEPTLEPEEDEPPVAPTVGYEQFVYTTDADAPDTPSNTPSPFVSAHDRRAQAPSRALVTANDEGPYAPELFGSVATPASPSHRSDPGDPSDPAGSVPDDAVDADAPDRAGGGGRDGDAAGAGAPTRGGDRLEGGAAARRGSGGAAGGRSGAASSGGGGGASGGLAEPVPTPEARRADRALPEDPARSWRPSVFRSLVARPAPPPSPAPAPPSPVARAVQPPSPTDGADVAVDDTPDDAADRGGTDLDADEEALATERAASDEGPGEGDAAGAVDPVEDLREALGWGGIDRDDIKPRAASLGLAGQESSVARSPQSVLDDRYELSDVTFVDARSSELGRYTQRLYDVLKERWYQTDLDPHARATGVQGNVTVLFRVSRSGRVSDVVVEKTSGHPVLDRLAVDAVPDRVPRIPRQIEDDVLVQRITFRYRNPLIDPLAR